MNDHQIRQSELYTKAFIPRNKRELNIANWVDKNYHDQQVILAKKEEQEQRIKQQNARNAQEAVKIQLRENELKRQNDRMQRLSEIHDVKRRVELSRKIEEDRDKQMQVKRNYYKDELDKQVAFNQFNRPDPGRLNEIERKMNRGMVDDRFSHLQHGARDIMKNHDTYRDFVGNAKKFYDGESVYSKSATPSVDFSFEKITKTKPNIYPTEVRPAGLPQNLPMYY